MHSAQAPPLELRTYRKRGSNMISYDMPISDYIAREAISASSLNIKSKVRTCPTHEMRGDISRTNPPPRAELFENAIRCALLEPITFLQRYLIEPEGLDRSSHEGRAYINQQASTGVILLKKNEFMEILAARDSVHRHPVVGAFLRDGAGVATASIFEQCPQTGVKMKCRPDYMIPSINAIFELKVTMHSEKSQFAKAVIKNQDHVREAFYRYAYECAIHKQLYDFLFIVIEKNRPFTVKVFELDVKTRLEGKRLVELKLQKMAKTTLFYNTNLSNAQESPKSLLV